VLLEHYPLMTVVAVVVEVEGAEVVERQPMETVWVVKLVFWDEGSRQQHLQSHSYKVSL